MLPRRRSSILKPQKSPTRNPLVDINSSMTTKGDRFTRRVSFAETCEVTEFTINGSKESENSNIAEACSLSNFCLPLKKTANESDAVVNSKEAIEIFSYPVDYEETVAMQETECYSGNNFVTCPDLVSSHFDQYEHVENSNYSPQNMSLTSCLNLTCINPGDIEMNISDDDNSSSLVRKEHNNSTEYLNETMEMTSVLDIEVQENVEIIEELRDFNANGTQFIKIGSNEVIDSTNASNCNNGFKSIEFNSNNDENLVPGYNEAPKILPQRLMATMIEVPAVTEEKRDVIPKKINQLEEQEIEMGQQISSSPDLKKRLPCISLGLQKLFSIKPGNSYQNTKNKPNMVIPSEVLASERISIRKKSLKLDEPNGCDETGTQGIVEERNLFELARCVSTNGKSLLTNGDEKLEISDIVNLENVILVDETAEKESFIEKNAEIEMQNGETDLEVVGKAGAKPMKVITHLESAIQFKNKLAKHGRKAIDQKNTVVKRVVNPKKPTLDDDKTKSCFNKIVVKESTLKTEAEAMIKNDNKTLRSGKTHRKETTKSKLLPEVSADLKNDSALSDAINCIESTIKTKQPEKANNNTPKVRQTSPIKDIGGKKSKQTNTQKIVGDKMVQLSNIPDIQNESYHEKEKLARFSKSFSLGESIIPSKSSTGKKYVTISSEEKECQNSILLPIQPTADIIKSTRAIPKKSAKVVEKANATVMSQIPTKDTRKINKPPVLEVHKSILKIDGQKPSVHRQENEDESKIIASIRKKNTKITEISRNDSKKNRLVEQKKAYPDKFLNSSKPQEVCDEIKRKTPIKELEDFSKPNNNAVECPKINLISLKVTERTSDDINSECQSDFNNNDHSGFCSAPENFKVLNEFEDQRTLNLSKIHKHLVMHESTPLLKPFQERKTKRAAKCATLKRILDIAYGKTIYFELQRMIEPIMNSMKKNVKFEVLSDTNANFYLLNGLISWSISFDVTSKRVISVELLPYTKDSQNIGKMATILAKIAFENESSDFWEQNNTLETFTQLLEDLHVLCDSAREFVLDYKAFSMEYQTVMVFHSNYAEIEVNFNSMMHRTWFTLTYKISFEDYPFGIMKPVYKERMGKRCHVLPIGVIEASLSEQPGKNYLWRMFESVKSHLRNTSSITYSKYEFIPSSIY